MKIIQKAEGRRSLSVAEVRQMAEGKTIAIPSIHAFKIS